MLTNEKRQTFFSCKMSKKERMTRMKFEPTQHQIESLPLHVFIKVEIFPTKKQGLWGLKYKQSKTDRVKIL